MSIHSPEQTFDAPPTDADLRSIQKTLWDVVPEEVAELTSASRPCACPAPALLKVYLRLRPLTATERGSQQDDASCLQVESETDVVVEPPKNSQAFKNGGRGGDNGCRYTFSKIFAAETTQNDLFTDTTIPLLQDVLLGESALLFTYGVTNAGKTFTVQGTPDEPGLLPRTMDVVFNSIAGHESQGSGGGCPAYFNDVKAMTAAEYDDHVKLKESILASHVHHASHEDAALAVDVEMASISGSDAVSDFDDDGAGAAVDVSVSTVDTEFGQLLDEDRAVDQTTLAVDTGAEYAVYVSYAEVYNEQVYDLLVPMSGKRRDAARLGEKDGDVYIRNLREMRVTSTADALHLVHAGQRNRRVAATKSNHESSRSHGIFTVKLIRRDIDEPSSVALSQFTIVDLAGSERYKKTDAVGERIKEAGTINTSLMTLGKCLESMRSKSTRKSNTKIVPYRDSKLTRLFKHYLQGKGSTSMVVNVANVNEHFDETAHVLKFSAMARRITGGAIVPKIDTGIHRLQREIEAAYRTDIEDLDTYNATLLGMLQEVKQQLYDAQCAASDTEERVREEVAEEMAEQMAELEERYESALSEQTEATESKFSKKWGVYTRSVARMPAVSRTQAGAADTTRPRITQLEAELEVERTAGAALQNRMDSALGQAEQKIEHLKELVGRLKQRLDEDEKEHEEEIAEHVQRAAQLADRAGEDRRLGLMGEVDDLKEQLADSKQREADSVARSSQLADEVARLNQVVHKSVGKAEHAKLRKEHATLTKDSTTAMQKSKLVIASLKRKVEEQQHSIEDLSKDIGSEETKYEHLRGQLVHALETRIESDIDESQSTKPRRSRRSTYTMDSTGGSPAAAASADPVGDDYLVFGEVADPAGDDYLIIGSAATAEGDAGVQTSMKLARGRRQKRKGTPVPDKENPVAVTPNGRTPKKSRTTGAPGSALAESQKGTTPRPKKMSMMSPLRRLRPRRKKADE